MAASKYTFNRKVSDDQIREMRARWDNRREVPVNQTAMAKEYDITQATVSLIVNRVTHAQVK